MPSRTPSRSWCSTGWSSGGPPDRSCGRARAPPTAARTARSTRRLPLAPSQGRSVPSRARRRRWRAWWRRSRRRRRSPPVPSKATPWRGRCAIREGPSRTALRSRRRVGRPCLRFDGAPAGREATRARRRSAGRPRRCTARRSRAASRGRPRTRTRRARRRQARGGYCSAPNSARESPGA